MDVSGLFAAIGFSVQPLADSVLGAQASVFKGSLGELEVAVKCYDASTDRGRRGWQV